MPPKRKRLSSDKTKNSDVHSNPLLQVSSTIANSPTKLANSRRSNNRAESPPSAPTHASHSYPQPDILWNIFQKLDSLSKVKSRCQAAILAISKATFLRPPVQEDDTDARLLVCSIYAIHQIMLTSTTSMSMHTKTKKKNKIPIMELSAVVAFMASRISVILFKDKSLLERTCNPSSTTSSSSPSPARTILRKGLLISLCASLKSLEWLLTSSPKGLERESRIVSLVLWTNINTLERLLIVNKKKVTPSMEPSPDSNHVPKVHQQSLSEQQQSIWLKICEGMDIDKTNTALYSGSKSIPRKKERQQQQQDSLDLNLGTTLSSSDDFDVIQPSFHAIKTHSILRLEDITILSSFLDVTFSNTSTTRPSKRSRKSTEKMSVPLLEPLSTFIHEPLMHGKITLKKFMSTALVHLCKGPHILLHLLVNMMQNSEEWSHVMGKTTMALQVQDEIEPSAKGKHKTFMQKVTTSGLLFLNVYASRLIGFIHDAEEHCAREPLDLEMHSYLSSVWQLSPALNGADICNVSIALMQFMLDIHEKSIYEMIVTQDGHSNLRKYFLANQQGRPLDMMVQELEHYHPSLDMTFDTLIKIITTQVGIEETKDPRLISGILASFILKKCLIRSEDHIFCDARLVSFALSQLDETITGLLEFPSKNISDGNVHNDIDDDFSPSMVESFLLLQPIVIDDSKVYSGVFSGSDENALSIVDFEDQNVKNGYLLGLFLRTCLPPVRGKSTSASLSQTPNELVLALLHIGLLCFAQIQSYSNESSSNITLCTLATDCLDVIRSCITRKFVPTSAHDSSFDEKLIQGVFLRSLLRSKIDVKSSLSMLVRIGIFIESVLTNSGTSHSVETESSNKICHRTQFVSVWERNLWTSYIDCCVAFTKGSKSSNAQALSRDEIFHLYECIHSNRHSVYGFLHLQATFHILLISVFTSGTLSQSIEDTALETVLCENVFAEILSSLKNPSILTGVTSYNYEFPLSKRDSQVFILALSRIPRKEQIQILSSFISDLQLSVNEIYNSQELRSHIIYDARYSGFLSRVITFCSFIVDIAFLGENLIKSFTDMIRTQSNISSFYTYFMTEASESNTLQDGTFFGLQEGSSHAELPSTYSFTELDVIFSDDDIKAYTSLIDCALELGFESGRSDKCSLLFSAWNAGTRAMPFAPQDWFNNLSVAGSNEHGKILRSIRESMHSIHHKFENTAMEIISPYSILMKQKLDSCANSIQEESSVSLLRACIKSSIHLLGSSYDVNSVSVSNESLQSSAANAVTTEATLVYISFIISMFTECDTNLMSTLALQWTKNKRKTSFSESLVEDDDGSDYSDEDDYHDDDMEDHDFKDDLILFEDICNDLGASPFHPDRLDKSCRLRPGLTDSECIDITDELLNVLIDFAMKLQERFDSLLKTALFSHKSGIEVDDDVCNVAMNLVRSICFINDMSDEDLSHDWKNELIRIFELDPALIEALSNDLPCHNAKIAKEKFVIHSVARLRSKFYGSNSSMNGSLYSGAEYRSAGEWELYFASAFMGSCAELQLSYPNYDEKKSGKVRRLLLAELLRVKRLLQGAISAIVTVSSLLRLVISGPQDSFQGQPFNKMGASNRNSDFLGEMLSHETSPITHYLSEKNLNPAKKRQVKCTIHKTLVFLGKIRACRYLGVIRRSARAAICNFSGDIIRFEAPQVLKNTFSALHKMVLFELDSKPIMEQLIQNISLTESAVEDFVKILLLSVGFSSDLKFSSIAGISNELQSALKKDCLTNEDYERYSSDFADFFGYVLEGEKYLFEENQRLALLRILRRIVTLEGNNSKHQSIELHERVLSKLNSFDEDSLSILVRDHICTHSHDSVLLDTSRNLCAIILQLFRPAKRYQCLNLNSFFDSIFTCLCVNIKSWVGVSSLDHVLILASVLSISLDHLKEMWERILFLVGNSQDDNHLKSLELFFKLILEVVSVRQLDIESDHSTKNASNAVPMRCTYSSTFGDFTEQHWYNCFTCGMIFDKGCCSSCAQICHKGHDVSYSRKSSFFCDCGAEVRTFKCKCLSPAYSEYTPSEMVCVVNNTQLSSIKSPIYIDTDLTEAALFIKSYISEEAKSAISILIQALAPSTLVQLLEIFERHFETSTDNINFQKPILDALQIMNGKMKHNYEQLAKGTECFIDRELSRLNYDDAFYRMRTSKNHLFLVSLDTDSRVDSLQKLLLANNTVERNLLITDSRGRMILCETNLLLFCSSSFLSNSRLQKDPSDNLEKREICVVGKMTTEYPVLGMSLSKYRDHLFVSWGFSSAHVHVVNKSFDNVTITIRLVTGLNFKERPSDFIVKAEWLTETIVAVFCAYMVQLYDIEQNCSIDGNRSYSCTPYVTYQISSESMIRSAVIISSPNSRMMIPVILPNGSFGLPKKKLVLLHHDGRLRMINVDMNTDGSLRSRGDIILRDDDVISFPIPDGNQFSEVTKTSETTTSMSMGVGSSLHFLSQSGLLLYKCVSSPMIAFCLDDNCDLKRSFVFLADIIPSDSLHNPAICGPYSHFCELDCKKRTETSAYRLIFTATSHGSGIPLLVYMEFNRTSSTIKVLSSPSHINTSPEVSFEGLSTFLVPKLRYDKAISSSTNPNTFLEEEFYAISITSNGCLSVYTDRKFNRESSMGENLKNKDSCQTLAKSQLSLPITFFETLENITDKECIIFGGDSFQEDSATLKRKLGTGCQEYVISQSLEGCTLTISFDREKSTSPDIKEDFDLSEYAIVAIRFLLGSTQTDFIPKEISVLGRPLIVHTQKKRWYEVTFTEEDIILILYSGVIPIYISGSTDDSRTQPTIDTVQVYGEKRNNFTTLFRSCSIMSPTPKVLSKNYFETNTLKCHHSESLHSLNLSITTIAHLVRLMDCISITVFSVTDSTLQHLIEAVSIVPNPSEAAKSDINALVCKFKKDSKTAQQLFDKGTIRGLNFVLRNLIDFTLSSAFENFIATFNDDDTEVLIHHILERVNICLVLATAIAKERPGNYKNSIESLISAGITAPSVSLLAKQIIQKCSRYIKANHTMELLIELIIHEASWNHVDLFARPSGCDRFKFADLSVLTDLLTFSDDDLVRRCCLKIAKVSMDLADHHLLFHQCDVCETCPILNVRYSMDEDGYDIDLCEQCYTEGSAFANSHDADTSVLIKMNPIHIPDIEKELTCSDIKKMTPKSVPNHSRSEAFYKANLSDEEIDDDFEKALALSMEDLVDSEYSPVPMQIQVSKTLLEIIKISLDPSNDHPRYVQLVSIINLSLTLALQCKDYQIKEALTKSISDFLCDNILVSCRICREGNLTEEKRKWVRFGLKSCLCALICLLTEKNDIEDIFFAHEEIPQSSKKEEVTSSIGSKEKTHCRFICGVHGIPAVRRRCSSGENKDKRFYVCGMERKSRCNYFKWADDSSSSTSDLGSNILLSPYNVTSKRPRKINSDAQSIILSILNRGTPAFHTKLCTFFVHVLESLGDNRANECNAENQCIDQSFRRRLINAITITDEEQNGLLGDFISDRIYSKHRFICFSKLRALSATISNQSIIQNCISFLTCVTSNQLLSSHSWDVWHIPLLQLISKTSSFSLKMEGKDLLKCLCGGDKFKYNQVRDSFTFASEFSKLLNLSKTPLETSSSVIEKGILCGPNWQSHSMLSWDQIRYGGMIGIHELISENAFEVDKMESLKACLIALVTVIKARAENWRHFCSLRKIPDINIHQDVVTDCIVSDFWNKPPICLLFWMMCILPNDLQSYLGIILDIALHGDTAFKNGNISSSLMKKLEFTETNDTPEKLLLIDSLGLSLSDIYSFVVTFVLRGSTIEIRTHSKRVASTLAMNCLYCNMFSLSDVNLFFKHLMTLCLRELALYGIAGIDLLKFIKAIMSVRHSVESIDFQYVANIISTCYIGQVAYENASPSFSRAFIQSKSKERGIEKIDIASCRFCESKSNNHTPKSNVVLKGISAKKRKSSDSSDIEVLSSRGTPRWVRGQLSDFNRIRLDMHHSVSSEFSSYVQLRSRLSISDIFLSLSDQRGRFVKNIAIFFSPKPVADFHCLSESQYDPFWQRLGTITLAKGSTSASLNLPYPVVAANLKFEFIEFHDKISEQKTAGGAMILHCPRCARVVNNAHGGVCANCGEVAFQCRKCRHINYDRLDAFLCVECGYCSSGAFTWELNAGTAICAVAIEDEADLERSIHLLQNKQKNTSNIRDRLFDLKAKLEQDFLSSQGNKSQDRGRFSKYDGPLKLAMNNKLPPYLLNLTSHPETKNDDAPELASSVGNKNRSLLNLILLQQAKRQRNFRFEDDSDMLDEGHISDPLSQIVASIQAHSRDGDGVTTLSRKNADSHDIHSKDDIAVEKDQVFKMIEEAKKLHTQMRSLDRDCHELESRIIAWKRLNCDEISPRGYLTTSNVYHPSKCSHCSPVLIYHLLDLLHAIFKAHTPSSEKVLNAGFIHSLFDDHEMSKQKLAALKRSVLVTIAKNSNIGSLLILDVLKHRLTGGRDSKSAEILRLLLESNSLKHHSQYVDLALETLNSYTS